MLWLSGVCKPSFRWERSHLSDKAFTGYIRKYLKRNINIRLRLTIKSVVKQPPSATITSLSVEEDRQLFARSTITSDPLILTNSQSTNTSDTRMLVAINVDQSTDLCPTTEILSTRCHSSTSLISALPWMPFDAGLLSLCCSSPSTWRLTGRSMSNFLSFMFHVSNWCACRPAIARQITLPSCDASSQLPVMDLLLVWLLQWLTPYQLHGIIEIRPCSRLQGLDLSDSSYLRPYNTPNAQLYHPGTLQPWLHSFR